MALPQHTMKLWWFTVHVFAIPKYSIEFSPFLFFFNSSKKSVTFIDNIGFNLCGQLIWIQLKKTNKWYTIAIRSLYRHVVCNGPVSCKPNRVGAWQYSDLLAIVYIFLFFGKSESKSKRTKLGSNSKMTYKHAAKYSNNVFLGVNKSECDAWITRTTIISRSTSLPNKHAIFCFYR